MWTIIFKYADGGTAFTLDGNFIPGKGDHILVLNEDEPRYAIAENIFLDYNSEQATVYISSSASHICPICYDDGVGSERWGGHHPACPNAKYVQD